MSNHYNAIVLGLGAMGVATVRSFSENKKSGFRVLGIDRLSPPHIYGSTHGETRLTRQAIGEGKEYTDLSLRSYEIWRGIERQARTRLLTITGGLIISGSNKDSILHGVEGSRFLENTIAEAERRDIRHEVLSGRDVRRKFPQFNADDDEGAYFEYDAGFLDPEECVRAQLELAEAGGVELHRSEQVLGFEPEGSLIAVRTTASSYLTEKLIITAGPWIGKLLEERYKKLFTVFQQTMFWFDVEKAIAPFMIGNFPVFYWATRTINGIYGFPAISGLLGGVKIATEQYVVEADPDNALQPITQPEIDAMYETCVRPYINGLSRRCIKAARCFYTVTPDFGFVIDRYPECENVLIASPCSGHGFKHSAAIGEVLRDIATTGESKIDVSSFSLKRFLLK